MSAKIIIIRSSARKYYNCTSIGLGSGATAASPVVARGPAITLALEICALNHSAGCTPLETPFDRDRVPLFIFYDL